MKTQEFFPGDLIQYEYENDNEFYVMISRDQDSFRLFLLGGTMPRGSPLTDELKLKCCDYDTINWKLVQRL